MCSDVTFDNLIKDPLKWVVSQAQEEGAEVYVLAIDIDGDGLNDVLIGENLVTRKNKFMKVELDWWIYLKVPGGYKEVLQSVNFNKEYLALENSATTGTRVITFFEDKRGDAQAGTVLKGDGHIFRFDPQTFFLQEGEAVNSTSDTFKTLFANNYVTRIKTLSQAEINRFYKIRVFPAGKREDYENDIIKYKDLEVLPRTDPSSDTTGTLLTYGIILGNYTTSETLQLQAQAGGTSQTLRAKGGKGGATGKDRKKPDSKVPPTPKAPEKASKKEKTPSVPSKGV